MNNYTPDYETPNYETPDYDMPDYDYNPQPVVPQKEKSIGLVALILGIVAMILNPFCATGIIAIILGIVGIATAGGRPKTKAVVGLVLGIISIPWHCAIDTIFTLLTGGIGGFSYLI